MEDTKYHGEFKDNLRNLMMASGLTVQHVSEKFTASIPSVKRWLEGTSKPVPSVQKLVLKYLDNYVCELQKE